MRIVFASYAHITGYNTPQQWLRRISFYTGIPEKLAEEHEVHSLEPVAGLHEIYRQHGVHYHFTRPGNRQPHFMAINRYISKLDPDIVLVHGLLYPLPLIHLHFQLKAATRVFVQHHAEQPLKNTRKWLQHLADRYITGYFFTSKELAAAWIEKKMISDASKVTEVMEGSSTFHRSPMDVPGKENHYLWVGRLDANKDPLTVVAAFLEFAGMHPGVQLFMIYQEDRLLPRIRAMMDQHPMAKSIHLLGKMDHEALEAWYHQCGFFIAASHYEGSGIALCEAMSCGCIPIVTKIDAFRKMTDEGRVGYVFEKGNVPSLLHQLISTKTNKREKTSEEVYRHFRDSLSFDAIADQMNRSFQPK